MCWETSRRGSSQNDAACSTQVWLTDARLGERARKLAVADTNQDQKFPETARKLALNIWTSTTWTTRSGRTISAYLEVTYKNLRMSTRIWDDNSNANQKTKWRTSMWICWHDECLGLSLSKPQFILTMLIWIIYIQPKISDKAQQRNNFSMLPRSWSKITKKFKKYPWSTGKKNLAKGWHCRRTEQFSCQQRKSMYSPNRYCAWEEFAYGKRKLIGLWIRPNVENWVELMGVPMEFEWKIFPAFNTLQILPEIQKMMTETMCEPEQHQGRIIFISLYLGGNEEMCVTNSKIVADCAKRFAHGHWSFLRPGSEQKWYGTHTNQPNENGNESLRTWYSTSVKADTAYSVHPVLLEWAVLKSKGRENLSIPLLWRRQHRWSGSSHDHLHQSARCLRSSDEHVWRAGSQNIWLLRTYRGDLLLRTIHCAGLLTCVGPPGFFFSGPCLLWDVCSCPFSTRQHVKTKRERHDGRREIWRRVGEEGVITRS